MRMKETTERSSNQLRGLATVIITVGIIIGLIMIIVGVVGMLQEDTIHEYRYGRGFIYILFNTQGVGTIISGLIIIFVHYIIYILISAYATLVENSDRSDVVDALMEINETLRGEQNKPDIDLNDERIKNAVAAEFSKADNNDDVLLGKIDISDIKE